jgi:RNA polymerase sigma-70 factor (ECF subfamily)
VRTCLDALRAEKRRPELRWSDFSEDEAAWLDYLVAESSAEPESGASDAREVLEKLLAQLAPPDRLVITLLDLERRPVKEIAQLTGWSMALVKVRAFRARRKLRSLAEALKETERYE